MGNNPTHVEERLDGDMLKSYPTGLASLMFAVQGYWTGLKAGQRPAAYVGAPTFCKGRPSGGGNFYATFQSVLKRWPGNRKLRLSGLSQHLPKLFEQTIELRYSVLAAFSAHCGLPTGLFLMYSKLVSMEMEHVRKKTPRVESRAELLEFLHACKAVIELAELQVRSEKPDRLVFNHYFTARKGGRPRGERRGDKHMAKADKLYKWSLVFDKHGSKFNPPTS